MSKKIISAMILLACGYFYFKKSPDSPQTLPSVPNARGVAQVEAVIVKQAPVNPDFEKEQDGYLKDLEGKDLQVENVYDDGEMRTELEVAMSESKRKQDVKMEIIRDVNDGEEPAPTDEERKMFAEMMAAQGLKSVYSTE